MEKTVDRTKLSNYNLILALLVVLIHTENIQSFPSLWNSSPLSASVRWFEWVFSINLAEIAVPSFFMISGVLFYRDFTMKKFPKKLKARFFSLILPFILWNFLRYAFFYILGKLGITDWLFSSPRVVFTWKNFFEAIFFYKFNQGFWFMYQLILFTLLAPVIHAIVKNKWVGAVVIAGLIALYCTDLAGPLLTDTLNKRFILLDSFIYYITGAYASTHFFDIINKNTKTTRILSIIGVIVGQLLYIAFYQRQFIVLYFMFLWISSISFWYLFDWFRIRPLPKCLSGITFFIYATHGTVLEFLIFASAQIGDTPWVALISYIITPVVTVSLIIGISIFLKKYTAPLWKILCGAR